MKIRIYQKNNPSFRVDKNQTSYNKDSYKQVWDREYPLRYFNDNDTEILEWLFGMLNREHPEDYTEHSLSVGDIVKLEDNLYVCCNCGWKKVEWK